VGPKIRPREFVGIVSCNEVRPALAKGLGDRHRQIVGSLGNTDDDVVARFNAGTPVDQNLCMLVDALIHTH